MDYCSFHVCWNFDFTNDCARTGMQFNGYFWQ